MPHRSPGTATTLDHAHLFDLVGAANAAVACFDGLLTGLAPEPATLSMLAYCEAVSSVRLEGAPTSVPEAFEYLAGHRQGSIGRQAATREALDYQEALQTAAQQITERPLTLGLITSLHRLLANRPRGPERTQGDEPMPEDDALAEHESAALPPVLEPVTRTPDPSLSIALQTWEADVHRDHGDPLVQVAMLHARFELLHPFRHGTSRTARLLVPLLLYSKGVIERPALYLSPYLEQHRAAYYRYLRAVSTHGRWTAWVHFFLQGLQTQARIAAGRARQLHALRTDLVARIAGVTHSHHADALAGVLFQQPVFRIGDLTRLAHIPKPTAHVLVRQLLDARLITIAQPAAGRRAALLAYPELLALAEVRATLPTPVELTTV